MDHKQQKYLHTQKKIGRHVLGVFPAFYPRELIWALNAIPVEIWDPPLSYVETYSHLQPYICSVVRLGLEFILAGKAKMIDAFLFSHTCDSVQNLASVVSNYIAQEKPCFFLYYPKMSFKESSCIYYLKQLKRLAEEIANVLEPFIEDRLFWALAQSRTIRQLIGELYEARACGRLVVSATDFYRVLRRGEWLWPEDHIIELRNLLVNNDRCSFKGPKIILSGILPNPIDLLSLFDELGMVVAHDDLLACGRRLLFTPNQTNNPWGAITEQYFSLPPCPTRGNSIKQRLEWLLKLVKFSKAKGVILLLVKFCEVELFDVPILINELKSVGIPVLSLEIELNQVISGQIITKVEVFLEMLK